MKEKNNIVEFKNIRKTFLGGKIVANDQVSFGIKKGSVHAIAGENGAGKSTLLSMLFGLYKPDSGSIIVKGKAIDYRSAADAMNDGLGMVQQHFQLVEKFSVGENILLGSEPSKFGFKNFKDDFNKINEISTKYKFGIKAKEKISSLTVGQQQKTEILKLLYRDTEILIFDEPTAMLIPQEIDELLEVIKKLKKQGKTIIIITHKLDEIKAVADRVSVLRKGKFVGTIESSNITPNSLSKLMVGRELRVVKKSKQKPGKILMQARELAVSKRGIAKLSNVSFDLREGEILAVAGVEGNGQTELANSILGLQKYRGELLVASSSFNKTIKKEEKRVDEEMYDIQKLSISKRNDFISSISEDRHKYGMVLDMKVYENMYIKNFWKDYSKMGFLKKSKMKIDARKVIDKYDVRGANNGAAPARGLSGGNQQKAIVGREIDSNKDILLIFQATRGLDVGAIEFIHKQILRARKGKKAILLISYDLNEIITLADRAIVLNSGKVTGEVSGADLNRNKIGILMSSGGE